MTIKPEAFAFRTGEKLDLRSEKQEGEAEQSLRSPAASLSRWAGAGILLSVLLIGFLSYVTLQTTRQAEEGSDWVVHTQAVQKALQSTLGEALDMVSGSRGFALTGQDSFLDVEARAGRALQRDLDTLRRLTVDNADQQKRFVRLQAQVNASLESTLKIDAARQRAGMAPPDSEFLEGKHYMDAVRATIGEMQDEETKLLVLRQEKARSARGLLRIVISSSALIGMALMTLSGFLLRRQIEKASLLRTVNEQREELARLAEFMQSIISSSPFATIVTNLQGVITSVNPAAERMLWYRREDLINLETPLLLLSPQQVANRAKALSVELHSVVEPGIGVLTANPRRGRLEESEWELVRRDGTCFDAQLTVSALTDANSGIVGYILIAYDITERKRAQDYIAHLAHHDVLTGLPTRTLFRDRLDAALAHATRYQRKVGILMVDLDNFKKINDLLGHKVGDEVLTLVAKRLQSCVRASDTVARMGGDEFTIILDELRSAEDADLVAGKIGQAIKMPIAIGSHTISPTASIGVSVYPDSGVTAEALYMNADAAMYQAKAEGRNGRHIYNRESESAASRKRTLEEGLNHALALEEFELVYQPQICMKTRMVTGVEALLRWRSGKLGLVMPGDFISLAEENGMIIPIGEWALRTACRQGKQLQFALNRPLTIAVNISPRQFQQNDLPQMIGKILAESKLSPSSLELEITENVLIGDLPRPKAILEQIRALGVHVAIDDFGTGFSSMAYVLRFRVDRLKIDQSFIRDIDVDPDSHAVTNAVIALAKGLHIPVVAEGVETAAHRDVLLSEGCDEAQGYFYSRPLSMEDIGDAVYAIEHSEG